ncbi:uncharacterized protein LOC125955691 isoform X2 [Anopheles darlingi]|uniref:uncharacterized protein LOC125955691 isoform X2 n=1 Tax=Anopheles darlingi TaxID=43151 RepID=UPI00210017F8|nr:uncharacterized protein LOC125955691 isoform X2 [Anopheles darlingi]XP_049542808.1 uncharacterized protein LOC125955691 isoform X2 [Anopheles darlingi]
MNDKALDITQAAFEGLGFELFDPSGNHVHSVKDLVVNATMQQENLSLAPTPVASDATLEEAFGIQSLETYDIGEMLVDLLEVIKTKVQELVPSTPVTGELAAIKRDGLKRAELMASKIDSSRLREMSLLIDEERREQEKCDAMLIDGVKTTDIEYWEQRFACRKKKEQLLMKLLNFITEQLMQDPKVDKFKLRMDVVGISQALGNCLPSALFGPDPAVHDVGAASLKATAVFKGPPPTTSAARSLLRNNLSQPGHSKGEPVLLPIDLPKTVHNHTTANVVQPSITKLNPVTDDMKVVGYALDDSSKQTVFQPIHPRRICPTLAFPFITIVKRRVKAVGPDNPGPGPSRVVVKKRDPKQSLSRAINPTHVPQVKEACSPMLEPDGKNGGLPSKVDRPNLIKVRPISELTDPRLSRNTLKQVLASPVAVSAAKPKDSTEKSMVTISYPASSQNQIKILNPVTDDMKAVGYALDDSSKQTAFQPIHPRRAYPTITIVKRGFMAVGPDNPRPGPSRVVVNKRDPKQSLSRAINPTHVPQVKEAVSPMLEPDGKNGGLPSKADRPNIIKVRPISELTDPRLSRNTRKQVLASPAAKELFPVAVKCEPDLAANDSEVIVISDDED